MISQMPYHLVEVQMDRAMYIVVRNTWLIESTLHNYIDKIVQVIYSYVDMYNAGKNILLPHSM